jgi:hypothetical protein
MEVRKKNSNRPNKPSRRLGLSTESVRLFGLNEAGNHLPTEKKESLHRRSENVVSSFLKNYFIISNDANGITHFHVKFEHNKLFNKQKLLDTKIFKQEILKKENKSYYQWLNLLTDVASQSKKSGRAEWHQEENLEYLIAIRLNSVDKHELENILKKLKSEEKFDENCSIKTFSADQKLFLINLLLREMIFSDDLQSIRKDVNYEGFAKLYNLIVKYSNNNYKPKNLDSETSNKYKIIKRTIEEIKKNRNKVTNLISHPTDTKKNVSCPEDALAIRLKLVEDLHDNQDTYKSLIYLLGEAFLIDQENLNSKYQNIILERMEDMAQSMVSSPSPQNSPS